MNDDRTTQSLREIELLDEDLEPIAGGASGGIVINPGPGGVPPILDGIGDLPVLRPIGNFPEPIIRDPLERVGGGVNRGFPGRNPEVEDIEAVVTVKWSNK